MANDNKYYGNQTALKIDPFESISKDSDPSVLRSTTESCENFKRRLLEMKLLHIGLLVRELNQSAHFYENILELKPIERPSIGFSGIWYDLGNGQQLHLMKLDNPYDGAKLPEHGGRDRHIAFSVKELDILCQRLEQAMVIYTRSHSGRAAIFCRDPDGNTIELVGV
ncbi:MAG: VOC family protein [Mariprofundaceae bacterium]